jgi:transcriptional regulator with XRE-family HTH domain
MRPRRDDPPHPDLIAFGALVQGFRMDHHMSQRKFAERVGISQSSVSRVERGLLPGLQLYRLVVILDLMGWLNRRKWSTAA